MDNSLPEFKKDIRYLLTKKQLKRYKKALFSKKEYKTIIEFINE
jgi:hypothetical protein